LEGIERKGRAFLEVVIQLVVELFKDVPNEGKDNDQKEKISQAHPLIPVIIESAFNYNTLGG
jgi:hypothetical protein